ncbi:hypothetical protein TIFTF001_023177 [Ficus carica]|uniref:Uncharacterized protein n=1 Tax=Ficus carica TaxID=3494 RepID=A0AA88DG32_FICCA|nr:hypothetical protein TIFTF001_023177 [Ficus carica]
MVDDGDDVSRDATGQRVHGALVALPMKITIKETTSRREKWDEKINSGEEMEKPKWLSLARAQKVLWPQPRTCSGRSPEFVLVGSNGGVWNKYDEDDDSRMLFWVSKMILAKEEKGCCFGVEMRGVFIEVEGALGHEIPKEDDNNTLSMDGGLTCVQRFHQGCCKRKKHTLLSRGQNIFLWLVQVSSGRGKYTMAERNLGFNL